MVENQEKLVIFQLIPPPPLSAGAIYKFGAYLSAKMAEKEGGKIDQSHGRKTKHTQTGRVSKARASFLTLI